MPNYIKGEMQTDDLAPPVEREQGYYWVQWKENELWYIAAWTAPNECINGHWSFLADRSQYSDSYFKEIDPEQIVRKHPKY